MSVALSEIVFTETNLVKTKKGTLPILLTCPHNGTIHPAEVPDRTGNNLPDGCDFKIDPDCNTFEITKRLAEKIFDLTNEWPYVVAFDVHRHNIDANRDSNCGCEVPQAEIYHDTYHSSITQFVEEIRNNNTCGNGLVFLIDIHGKDNNGSDISIGTRNKKTIQPIMDFNPGWDWDYQFGLLYLLKKKGYTISPDSPCKDDDPKYFGGYTVKRHGGWQFEIAKSKRDPGVSQDKLVDDFAEIFHTFYKHNCIQGI